MPVYAPTSPAFSGRRLSPRALTLIVAAHAAAVAAVMSVRMDLPTPFRERPTVVTPIPLPQDPPPPAEPKEQPKEAQQPAPKLDWTPPIIKLPLVVESPTAEPLPMPVPSGDIIGPKVEPMPQGQPVPKPAPVRTGPRFATPDHALKPPYPASKLDSDEGAALRLRLTIDERGRVVGVEPVGKVDPVFFEAARRHLLARWRYKPATEDCRPVGSSTVITLRFELEG